MKALRTPLIAASLLAALSVPAFAQMGPGMHGPEAHAGAQAGKMRELMAERHEKHLAELKAKLQLQPSQEEAWKNFAQAMQPPAQRPARPDRAALEKLTTPERIDQMMALHAQREAEMKKHADATKSFYASLNPAQKTTFDAETAKFMGSAHGWQGRHHH